MLSVKPSVDSLIIDFKEYLEEETGYRLDFRRHGYLENGYNLSPTFNYDFAKMVIENLYDWAQELIHSNQEAYGDFHGFAYNLQMSCEELRTVKLKDYISNVCFSLHHEYSE